jgi:hypothetical protein
MKLFKRGQQLKEAFQKILCFLKFGNPFVYYLRVGAIEIEKETWHSCAKAMGWGELLCYHLCHSEELSELPPSKQYRFKVTLLWPSDRKLAMEIKEGIQRGEKWILIINPICSYRDFLDGGEAWEAMKEEELQESLKRNKERLMRKISSSVCPPEFFGMPPG